MQVFVVGVFVVGSFVVACSVKVARLPRAGESLDAVAFVSEPGGKGFNLALAAHRLGARVDGVFAIGTDALAAVGVSAFDRVGFPPDMLVRKEGSTGAGVGFVDTLGENCLAVSLGANRQLAAADIEATTARLARAELVMATFESPDAPIEAAFVLARSRGATTLLNPSPMRPIEPRILAHTSILVVNRVEAADLGLDPAGGTAAVDALMAAGPDLVVVTLGEDGAIAHVKGSESRRQVSCRQTAFRVPVIDTIGAGDAFAAGLAVSLLQGRPIEAALYRAAASGALTTCRFGAFDAFPTASELDRFIAMREANGDPLR